MCVSHPRRSGATVGKNTHYPSYLHLAFCLWHYEFVVPNLTTTVVFDAIQLRGADQ